MVWLFIKNDNAVKVEEKIEVSDTVESIVEEKQEEVVEDKEISEVYEIIEQDGFFKVRKKGSERTIRKFLTELEAINYVKEKE